MEMAALAASHFAEEVTTLRRHSISSAVCRGFVLHRYNISLCLIKKQSPAGSSEPELLAGEFAKRHYINLEENCYLLAAAVLLLYLSFILSAISAINSELVGLPLPVLTV